MRRCKQPVFISFLLLMPFILFAQSSKISGTVTDSSGRGIPSVTVTEKGTKNSAATNKRWQLLRLTFLTLTQH